MALKIVRMGEDLAEAKRLSQDSEDALKEKVNEFMSTEDVQKLNKKAEDARVEYEEKRVQMLKEMQKQEMPSMKTKSGAKISISKLTKVHWEDEEKIVKYLEKNSPDLVKKSINKGPAKKFLLEELALGNTVNGFETTEEDSLTVKV